MTELLRFYEDLGIIANNGSGMERNENLMQGQQYMEHRRYDNRHTLNNMIEKFSNNNSELNNNLYHEELNNVTNDKTIEGRKENIILETTSNKYHYFAWLFLAIFIIWSIFNIYLFSVPSINLSSINFETNTDTNNTNLLYFVIIVALIIILIIIFNEFNSNNIKLVLSVYDDGKINDKSNDKSNDKKNYKK